VKHLHGPAGPERDRAPCRVLVCKEQVHEHHQDQRLEIHYKDWSEGPAVTLSHGWPLSADAWDGQMLFLAHHGFRAVALDRRGHGRSSQVSSGNDMNGDADDLAAIIEGAPPSRRRGRRPLHRRRRGRAPFRPSRNVPRGQGGADLGGTVEPREEANPDGLPIEAFDDLLADMLTHQDQVNADLLAFWHSHSRPRHEREIHHEDRRHRRDRAHRLEARQQAR
jgi:non-heme chloroperoxidase